MSLFVSRMRAWMRAQNIPKSALVDTYDQAVNGYVIPSERPGLGIRLIPNVEKEFPPIDIPAGSRLNIDGSVRDQ